MPQLRNILVQLLRQLEQNDEARLLENSIILLTELIKGGEGGEKDGRSEATTVYYYSAMTNRLLPLSPHRRPSQHPPETLHRIHPHPPPPSA